MRKIIFALVLFAGCSAHRPDLSKPLYPFQEEKFDYPKRPPKAFELRHLNRLRAKKDTAAIHQYLKELKSYDRE